MNRTLHTVIMILLTAAEALAQIPAGGRISVNVSATVVSNSPVVLTTLSNMVISSDKVKLKEIYISPVSNPSAGLMLLRGLPGSQARLTYLINETLTAESDLGKIAMAFEVSSYPTLVQRASELNNSGEVILNFGADGTYYLWIGGRVNLNEAIPGKYKGQFTLEIVYI